MITESFFKELIEGCDHINMATEDLIAGLNFFDIVIEECSICEKTVLEEKIEYMNGSPVCDKCSIVTIPCYGCSSLIHTLEDDLNYHNNNPYCDDCWNELTMCDHCDDITEDYRKIEVDGNTILVCRDCQRNSFFRCNCCNKWFHQDEDNQYSDPGGNYICEDCYTDEYCNCSSCGDMVHNDESCYDEYSDNVYCQSCYRSIEDNMFEDEPDFKVQKSSDEDEPFAIGMELELECDDNRRDISRYVRDDLYPLFYSKKDASLSDRNGIEIPCQPMSWEYFMEDGKDKLTDLLEYLQDNNCKAWDTNAGIHISLAKRGFNTIHTYKFLKFFYENPEYIFKISRRKKWNFEKYCGCKFLNRKGLVKKFQEDWKGYGGDKYEAVNLNHPSHYEVRIFAGTLKTSSVLANIEFCRGVYMYSKQEKAKDISVQRFEQYILGFDPDSYRNFINLFKLKG